MTVVSFINTYIFAPVLPLMLFLCGAYFCIRVGGYIVFHPIKTVLSLFKKTKKGATSPFRALCVALAGTLGVGNIAGVATALTAGGAGSIFWMWIAALFSMILKYAETLLAVAYRKRAPGGGWRGGAHFYISVGCRKKGIAALFAILCLFSSLSIGNPLQSRAVCDCFSDSFNIPPFITAASLALFVFFAVRGGKDSITSLTSKLIPALTLLYTLFSLYIIVYDRAALPSVFARIFDSAFSFRSAGGGLLGFIVMRSLRFGVARGLATNEAGCGSAPIAHAAAETDSGARQGILGIFEVFIDTIVLCTLTALVILLAAARRQTDLDGMRLAIDAYEVYFGQSAGVVMSISVFAFALAAIAGWCYYGSESLLFLTNSGRAVKAYLILYSAATLLAVAVSEKTLWELSDFSISAMTVINLCALVYLRKTVISQTIDFYRKKFAGSQ